MTNIATGAVNHFALTVTDKERSRDFYTKVLNFQMVVEFGPKFLLSNGSVQGVNGTTHGRGKRMLPAILDTRMRRRESLARLRRAYTEKYITPCKVRYGGEISEPN